MASVFTKILQGELPGRFVHRDDVCAAFLSIAPLKPGHTLVVPLAEVDHWVDLDDKTAAHLMTVARRVGVAQQEIWSPERIGLIIAGMEVPHTHLHVIPIWHESDLHFGNADPSPGDEALDDAQQRLAAALGFS